MGGLLPRGFAFNWRDGKPNDLIRNWLSFALLSLTIFMWFGERWYLSIVLVACLFLFFLWLHNLTKFRFYRVFMEEFLDSMDKVDSVLTSKGIPFKRKKNRFYVEDIEIELKTYSLKNAGDFGTQISISSINTTSKPLMDSLMQKMDESFLYF